MKKIKINKITSLLCICLATFSYNNLRSITIGSDTEVSKEEHTLLVDQENRIAGFAFMANGFF